MTGDFIGALGNKDMYMQNPGGATQKSFIRGGSAPRSNPLPFYIPFFSEKAPLLYTFYWKKAPLSYTFL